MAPSSPEVEPGDDDSQITEKTSEKRQSFKRFLKLRYIFFLIVLLISSALMAGYGHYTDPGPLPESKALLIPHGGVTKVTAILQENNILSKGQISSLFFQLVVRLTSKEGPLQAAEFIFPERVSIAHILEILRHGKPLSHNITIAEGLTVAQVVKMLQSDPLLKGEIPPLQEGTIFPQTFSYLRDTDRLVLIKRMQHLMTITLQKIWDKRDKKALAGLIETPQQLLILASLIERETSVASERPHIARVFLNRLKQGMKLQTDPTVIYAVTEGQADLGRPLSHEDLLTDSPYNTYRITGLPPGPICNPGLASLEAAAHPEAGDDLYFVATGQGGHYFAKTLKEQTQHVKAYRQMIRSVPGEISP